MSVLEIDYRDDNKHIYEKGESLIVQLSEFPDGYIGKIEQEFIEILNSEGKPTGKFEEFIFKEIEEDERRE